MALCIFWDEESRQPKLLAQPRSTWVALGRCLDLSECPELLHLLHKAQRVQ